MHKSRHMQHKSYGFITMSCFTLAIIKLCICAPMYLLTALKQGRWLGMPMGTLYGALWPVSDVRSKSSPIGGLTRLRVTCSSYHHELHTDSLHLLCCSMWLPRGQAPAGDFVHVTGRKNMDVD